MSGFRDEAWVTVASDDESSLEALVLAKSLRRSMTNRKLLVLISPSVTRNTRKILDGEFDGVIKLGNDLAEKGEIFDFKTLAKLYCWALPFPYKKCIFLDPRLLILKNIDDFFALEGIKSPIWKDESPDTSIILLNPSLDIYNALLEKITSTAINGNKIDGEKLLGEWISSQKEFTPLPPGYLYGNNQSGSTFVASEPKISQFRGEHPFELVSKQGIQFTQPSATNFETNVLEYWKTIYSAALPIFRPNGQISEPIQSYIYKSEPIAIVGMGCRLPGANTLDEFWELLVNGRDAMHPVPNDRWTKEQGCAARPEDRRMNAGFLKCPIDEFDGKFFGMSSAELPYCDPQQRLLLEVAWEALEDAAINPETIKDTRTGIFSGMWRSDYYDLMTESGFRGTEFYRSYMGNSFGANAGRLSYFLGVTGSNIATESGCSSSIVALGLAIKSLRNRESNMSLACGTNLLLNPFTYEAMQCVISPDGLCKTFSEDADGFARAEGCGVLVLKRLSDAVRDNDRVYALIRGYGEAQEGPSKSMGTPTAQCESLAMELALQDAGVEPNEVSYVEAHGTGTPVGDPMEMIAIRMAYSKNRVEPLIVGSVKTNVGHTESCSGITGIIKTVLSLQNEIIPLHLNLTKVNKLIELESIPAVIPLKATPWKRDDNKPRIAGVSSFGITGTDAHVIIQEAPQLNKISKLPITLERPFEILALSAKSEAALDILIANYEKYLQENPSVPLSDVTFTANAGRVHFRHRAAILGKNSSEILKNISNKLYNREVVDERPQIGFLFTGQGSQFHQMGKQMYETSPIFRQAFDTCDEILSNRFKVDIRKHLFCAKPSEELNRTLYSQISIYVIEYCTVKVWESWGIKPDLVLGHSLGEMAAATVTGVMSLEDGLRLVSERSRLIDNLQRGKMLVVRGDKQTVEQILNKMNKPYGFYVDFAAFNYDQQTVVAGNEKSITAFSTFLRENKVMSILLNSTHAFHSRDMNKMLPQYKKVADSLKFSQPSCQFVSGVDGKLLEGQINTAYWARHTRESVKFVDASNAVHSSTNCRLFLEVGPQPILNTFLTHNSNGKPEPISTLASMRETENQWQTMLTTLGKLYTLGFPVNWAEFYRCCDVQKVRLPTYPFQRQKHWFELSNSRSTLTGGKQLHPLLGCTFPNATAQKFYQNRIDLNHETYLRDHLVGRHVIYPGAGYLEMVLAGGYASTLAAFEKFELPTSSVVVENIMIAAPLELIQSESIELQTVISTGEKEEDAGWSNVQVFSLQGESSGNRKWIGHISARFSSFVPSDAAVLEELKDIQDRLGEKSEGSDEFYKKIYKNGLKFGPNFRSLKKAWKNEKEMLFEMESPEEIEGYLCHPILSDAMIQALLWDSSPLEVLEVPISIGQFIWLGKSNSQLNYVHIFGESGSRKAALFGEDGQQLALMSGVQFVSTNLESITRSVESQKLSLPLIFEDQWKPDYVKQKPFTKKTELNSEEARVWLIFSAETDFQKQLSSKLEKEGKTVVKVRCGEKFQKINDSEFEVRLDTMDDFNQVVNVLPYENKNNLKVIIEGIIYCWGSEKDLTASEISQGYLNLMQSLLTSDNSKELPKLFVITKGAVYVGDQGPELPNGGVLWGMSKTLRSEHPNVFCRFIDIDPYGSNNVDEVFEELENSDKEYQIAYRQGVRQISRLMSTQLLNNPLHIPKNKRYSLVLPASNSINDLKYGAVSKEESPLNGNEIEIKVKACGLNFKDVLNVLKPTAEFANSNSVGADYAGIVSRIGPEVKSLKPGDAVLGCNWDGVALPSHISSWEDTVVPLPSDWTFADGATLGTAFATAFYCLVTVAKLARDETILIHTASGAVGICAIQIAKVIGARIIVTAGNKRKRAFLTSFGLKHIFNSRELSFEKEILEVTNGKGVQVVLNSLTSAGFKEASLDSCAKNARFVEMSKLNIWSEEEVKDLRPDVKYTIVDMSVAPRETWSMIFGRLHNFLVEGKLKPIVSTRFDALNIREALTYLQKAKHVGKVVCLMPEDNFFSRDSEIKSYLFNDRSTYLITGGLGGIGLEVAKWMADLGAKYIVLCGRSSPNDRAQSIIDNLNTDEENCVQVIQADVGKYDDCLRLLQSIKNSDKKLPPLRGVMHAAGCLSDGIIVNQKWENFESTFNGKVIGGWNLHKLTLDYNLEHFVVYSSIASVFGAMGQSNHAAGNAYLDSLAQYRYSLGLPSTSINWGQWGQVGIAAELEIPGLSPFTPLQALSALELVMKSQRLQTMIVEGDVAVWKLMFSWAINYFSELKTGSSGGIQGSSKDKSDMTSNNFWTELNAAEDKLEVVNKYVKSVLACILKYDPELFDVTADFKEYGVDSLMNVEMKNMLQAVVGSKVRLTTNDISDIKNINHLSTKLLQTISGSMENGNEREKEKRNLLIREDCILLPHIKASASSPCENTSETRNILVTGGTGTLAPYIIQKLSNRNHVDKVYCLIRAKSPKSGLERLVKKFTEKGILDQINLEKIQVIPGNLTEPNLGICDEELYKKLAQEVQGVVHCAAKSNPLEEYRKSSDLRNVNVIGTVRVLEFASDKKTKWVFHSSTLQAMLKGTSEDVLPETWPKIDEFDDAPKNFAYETSKFVCDQLMAEAQRRGIPVKVFRFPIITGDSKEGRQSIAENSSFLRYLCYMTSEMMPDHLLPLQVLPVDVAAELSLQVFFTETKLAQTGIYNVTNPHDNNEFDLIGLVAKLGYSIKKVPFAAFATKIKEDGEKSLLHFMEEFYTNEDGYLKILQQNKLLKEWAANPKGYYVSRKFLKVIPEIKEIVESPLEILKRDFSYAIKIGFLPKPK